MKKLVKHWCILCYFLSAPIFLLVTIALTVTNTLTGCLFDFRAGQIKPGTFGAALTQCAGYSGSSMLLSYSILESTSAAQSSSLSLGLSKPPVQLSQFPVSKRVSGALSSPLSTGWGLILQILWTVNMRVRPRERFLADMAGGQGDLSENWKAPAPSCWKSDQDALTISSVSEMYNTEVICLFSARDSFCVARRFWLPCHISKLSWTLAILCNVISSASFINSELLSVFIVPNSGSVPATIPLLARANWLTMTFSRTVSAVVFDCLQPKTSRPTEQLDSTLIPCDMIEDVSRATLERSVYFECVSSCWSHRLVMSGIQNVLLI